MIQDPVFWSVLFGSATLYWALPQWLRRYFLAAVSLGMVFYYDHVSFLIIVALSLITYFSLPVIAAGGKKSLALLLVNIVALAGPLITLKSLVWVVMTPELPVEDAARLLIPLGISYYVFRMLHVVIDAYRRGEFEVPAEDYFCYVYLFTIFPAGPIQRLDSFQSGASASFRSDNVLYGLTRIALGLVKQTFVIDLVFSLRDHAIDRAGPIDIDLLLELPVDEAWLVVFTAYVTSYLNLGAYTDIAIGASRLYGFTISENFRFPLLTRSIGEFWRSWHLTLSGWCLNYIYSLVLGITRNPYLGILLSFQVMGLWHVFSLNRIAWGLFHGLAVLTATRFGRMKKPFTVPRMARPTFALIAWVATQAYVSASWVFVIAENTNDILPSLRVVAKLFSAGLIQ